MTLPSTLAGRAILISTHTSLAGRDLRKRDGVDVTEISTHTSLAGRDFSDSRIMATVAYISTHTSLAGRDHRAGTADDRIHDFYSHVPRGT